MPRAVCLDFEYGQGRVSPDLPNITYIFVLGEPLSCSHLRGNPSDRSPIGADEANRSLEPVCGGLRNSWGQRIFSM